MTDAMYDVIIAGGGIMGCATAFYLAAADDRLKIAVVEPDPTYEKASTTLSLANVRVQFSLKQNIQISQYTLEVLDSFEEDMIVDDQKPRIAFRTEGNLFLVDESNLSAAKEAMALQAGLACRVEWWAPEKIHQVYPLYKTQNILAGTFGCQDGHLDAYGLLMGYKAKSRSMGVAFTKDRVTAVQRAGQQVTGVAMQSGQKLLAGIVVNCAGAWADQVAHSVGIDIPVVPVKRQVFVMDTKFKLQGPLPLTILPSGLYFRTETGGLIIMGKSMPEDPVGIDFSWDDKRFQDILWPELAEFVPAFDTLKLMRGWAGLYAVNTLDGNAIVGEWPELKGFYLANGFSGHGLQQAPAVGRYISELITGQPLSLDLGIFSPHRILDNKPLSESGLV